MNRELKGAKSRKQDEDCDMEEDSDGDSLLFGSSSCDEDELESGRDVDEAERRLCPDCIKFQGLYIVLVKFV